VVEFADTVTQRNLVESFLFWAPDPATAVSNVPGVTNVEQCRDFENGLLTLTVRGGDDQAVAEAIHRTRQIGIQTLGNTAVTIRDSLFDLDFEIRFNRQ
jgi:hypothetical protein